MRIFVYEYLSSGAAETAAAAPSLQTEGWAMLSAVVEDFAHCRGVETVALVDPRLRSAAGQWPARVRRHFAGSATEEQTFRKLAAAADYALVIAPEFDGILAERCRWVEEEGRLLGPSTAAVYLTADKLTLARHWRARGIPTPSILEWPSPAAFASLPYSLVLKPRAGAGSQATFSIHNGDELAHAILQAGAEGWSSELILQPYCPGRPVSVAFLVGAGRWLALPAAEQQLSNDGRFRYQGGRVPLTPELDGRARQLAERAARMVDGLQGWFGVDLVLGANEDGSGDVVIEINPRLTTSYVGLRRLARFNLAEAMLAFAAATPLPRLQWGSKTLAFRACYDGNEISRTS